MYYYFCSEYLSAIKLNGIYYGTLTDNIKSLRIDDCFPLVEVCPLVADENNVNFILDTSFLSCPVKNVCVTDLKGGYLIKFIRRNLGSEFRVICQQKFSDCAATVFIENGLKISLETQNDFIVETLNLKVESAKVFRFDVDGKPLVAITLNNIENTLIIYSICDKIKKVFCRVVESFSTDNKLQTIEQFNDIAKHKIVTDWGFDNDLIVKNANVTVKNGFSPQTLNKNIVPFAFCESFLLGAEWKDYLTGNVLENCDKLKGFLGEFIGVLPPPTFRDISEVGLLYKESENLYKVEYFTFTLDGNKICGVQKCD